MMMRHIQLFPFLTLCLLVAGPAPAGQEPLPPLNRFPRMVQEYFVERVRRIENRGNRRRSSLKTREDAERYVRDIRRKIQRSFGPWPERRPSTRGSRAPSSEMPTK